MQQKTGTFDQPFQFSTKRYDARIGMVQYEFRNYLSVIGRWMTRDPFGEAGGLNLYAFVGNHQRIASYHQDHHDKERGERSCPGGLFRSEEYGMNRIKRICVSVMLIGIVVHSTAAETIQYRYDAGNRLIRAQTFQRGVTWEYSYLHTLAENRSGQHIAATTACADRIVCNGNFEQGFAAWDGANNAALVAGYTGQGANVMLDTTDSNIFQNIPGVFEAGHTYRATARCFAANGRSCHLTLFGQSQHTK